MDRIDLRDLRTQVFRGTGWLGLRQFLELAAGVASAVLLIRALGPADYGVFVVAMSLLGLSGAATGNFDESIRRLLPELLDAGDGMNARRVVKTVLMLRAPLAAVATVTMVLLAPYLAAVYKIPALHPVLAVGSATYAAAVLTETASSLWIGQHRFGAGAGFSAAGTIATLAAVVMAVTANGSLTWVVAAIALAQLTTGAASLAVGWSALRHRTPGGLVRDGTWRELIRRVAAYSLPLWGAAFGYRAYHHLAGVVLGFTVSPAQVGYFGLAKTTIERLTGLYYQLPATLVPVLSAWSRRAPGMVIDTVASLARWIGVLSLVLCAATALFAREIVVVLGGPAYLPAEPLLRILSVQFLFRLPGSIWGTLLYVFEHTATTFWLNATRMTAALVAFLIAVPRYGLSAAAVVEATSYVIPVLYMMWNLPRRFPMMPSAVMLPTIRAFAAAIMLVPAAVMALDASGWPSMLGRAAVVLIGVPVAAVVTGLLPRNGVRGSQRRLVLTSPSVSHGGAEEHLAMLARGLRERDDVTVLISHEPGTAPVVAAMKRSGIHVLPLRLPATHPRWRAVRDVLSLCSVLRRHRPDLIHIVLPGPTEGTLLGLAARLAQIPFVLDFQLVPPAVEILGQWRGIRRAIHRWVCMQAAARHTLSRGNARRLAAHFRLDPSTIDVIHAGIEIDRYEKPARTARREDLGLPPNGPVVMTVARLDQQKGLEHLVKAAHLIRSEQQPHFVLVGDGPLRADLQALAHRLGVAPRVTFLGFRADVPELLPLADLFVLPSIYEGFGMVVVEAMAAGKPVVASRVDGIVEILEDGSTGVLVEAGDAPALARAIDRLLDDPALRETLGQRARAAARRFDWLQMIIRTRRLHDRVLGLAGPHAEVPAIFPRRRLAVVVAPEPTAPVNSGSRLRMAQQIATLKRLGYAVRTAAFAEQDDGQPRPDEDILLWPFETRVGRALRYLRAALQRTHPLLLRLTPQMPRLLSILQDGRPDLVILEQVPLAGLVPHVRRVVPAASVVVDAHNAEASFLSQLMEVSPRWWTRLRHWVERNAAARLEREVLGQADEVWVPSELDAAALATSGVQAISIVPNAVDIDAYVPEDGEDPGAMVFTGIFSHLPNVDAAEWLCREIFPKVLAAVPHAHLYLVGRDDMLIRRLAGPRVTVTGPVPDVRPYLRRASVVVAPLRYGSGTRLKLLEAFAMEKSAVSTSKGCEGLDVTHSVHLRIANDAEQFARHVIELLQDPIARRRIGAAARRLVEEHYSWRAVESALRMRTITGRLPASVVSR